MKLSLTLSVKILRLLIPLTLAHGLRAEESDDGEPIFTPTIEVISQSPLLGSGIDADKAPTTNRVLKRQEISKTSAHPSLTKAISDNVSSVNLNATYGNSAQPDLLFRGFTASPVVGVPQGFAVYQNGVRVNEAFGDTVNWDLVPDFAIDSLNLTSTNPVYGFNALGGSAAVQMKTGFTFHGIEAETSGGSFGRVNASAQYGQSWGNWAYYVGVSPSRDGGWREHSASRSNRFYSDLGFDDGKSGLHLDLTWNDNSLGGSGPTPEWLLGSNWGAANTGPGSIDNQLFMSSLRGSLELSKSDSIQGNLYIRQFHQRLRDGNASEVEECSGSPGFFCSSNDDGSTFTVPVVDQNGAAVPLTSIANSNFPAEIDIAETRTQTVGMTTQFTSAHKIYGHDNQWVGGVSLDHALTGFNSTAQFGSFNDSRQVQASPLVVTSFGTIHHVSLQASTLYTGVYLSDTFDLRKSLSITGSARYNVADITLTDDLGGDLNGTHHYQRLNPSLGLAYKLSAQSTLFADYAESNRTPTAAELSCASPTQSCSLATFFVADPDLQQVVARTFEVGARGARELVGGQMRWNAGLFATTNENDIIQIASPQQGKGYFQNAGTSLRRGLELGLTYHKSRWQAFADYSLVDATFQSDLAIYSPNNPAADSSGKIAVHKGDRMPNIPLHRLKMGADYWITKAWALGVNGMLVSGQFLQGDESNQNVQTPGYGLISIHSHYLISKWLEAFGSVDNVLNQRYYAYGVLAKSDGVPPGNQGRSRSYTPGEPCAVLIGLRAQL